mmetsp:Transcript_96788/g.174801  ORF Transcript_96788/g.174801 Transcript_96788/m.174801 type:complete len:331 (+) Transcript_96788:96-1088(+)|eukprot:CAMPEP_0115057718 /NCGR_PEP_ID=MMETSP0227-20121206/5927_1 /TAXON_ID=89957 /ORGANISM="Polarella glacialis, Strain CCMP 1383" /LENGTH=330 /DNA_ID=CAMNT_0002442579 /DNA_START=96 /DNA_END=1088 /DNA_ORIENTATION=-
MGISLETSDVLAERRHRSASSADTAGSETNSEEVCAENSQGQTCKRTQARWADLSEEDAHWAELSGEEDELSTQDSLDRVEYPKKHCQDRTTEKLGDSHQSSPVPVERAGERRPARDTREARRSSESLRWSVKGSPLADAADAEVPARPRRSAHTQQSEWEGSKWGSQSWEGGWSKSSRNKSSWEHSSWPDKADEADQSWFQPRHEKGGPKRQCQYVIGIEEDKAFRVGRRLLGPSGQNMKAIADKTGARLRLRGRGSWFLEGPQQKESNDPLMLCVSAPTEDGYERAVQMVEPLLKQVYVEFAEFCDKAGWTVPKLRLCRHDGARKGSR